MNLLAVLLVAVATVLVLPSQSHCCALPERITSFVRLTPSANFPDISGDIQLTEISDCQVNIVGSVSGLSPDSWHGFHIHQNPEITNNCIDAGPHFNPFNANHGAPIDLVRHVGDLGNIHSDSNGVAEFNFIDSIVKLDGDNSIIGRTIVVHWGQDDFGKGGFDDSLTTGHAGERAACGVISQYKS